MNNAGILFSVLKEIFMVLPNNTFFLHILQYVQFYNFSYNCHISLMGCVYLNSTKLK